ncbi:MAG: DNA topoisomerase [Lachnospiraceae bacterium]
MKQLYITEKPSVAREFSKAIQGNFQSKNGYMESDKSVITWCVGHLVTMSYPDAYDPALKRWTLETLPFLPKEFKYELIPSVKEQFNIVKSLLLRDDIDTIYVCTDSGREGEYIYRLVDQMIGVLGKAKKRVWIDSQTEEEILRGIEEAKDLSEYDNIAASAYLRAKEDYLMGINFSRLLTLKYGWTISNYLNTKKNTVIAIGRVMTCVIGIVVKREREIRSFKKTAFYKIIGKFGHQDTSFEGEWRAVEGSKYFQSPFLYKDNGFLKREKAEEFIIELKNSKPAKEEKLMAVVEAVSRKKEKKNPSLLYNLAELQNDSSRYLKLTPDETLKIVQELYEKKLVTYPRTDARVLSTAVAKEIAKNISGLCYYQMAAPFAQKILESNAYTGISKTKYVNDKLITDHYAIIPTGQGLRALSSVSQTGVKIYEMIVRRFLSIFYPPAVYQKTAITFSIGNEKFFVNSRYLLEEGYLPVAQLSFLKQSKDEDKKRLEEESLSNAMKNLRKGMKVLVLDLIIKEGETSPPKRYNSGSLILTMENAGQFIEDEDLRAQIKGSGIGTSATRAEILKKLDTNGYVTLNKKTQTITPTLLGELIHDVVACSIRSLLNPELTASWEKGLSYVAEGTITEEEYMEKLENFISTRTQAVLMQNNPSALYQCFDYIGQFYQKKNE